MIYVTGDMHGDKTRMNAILKRLGKKDILIVLGDFGFIWDGNKKEREYLEYLGSRKCTVCFIDGTHENYDLIAKSRQTMWKKGLVHRISGNCLHLCRGQIFYIDRFKIFTFGGGESVDKDMRIEGKTWWKQEMPTSEEMAEGAKNIDDFDCDVDVILTHEPPSKIKTSMQVRANQEASANKLNTYFDYVNECCTFRKWYFGSMHEDKRITRYHTSVFNDVIPITNETLDLAGESFDIESNGTEQANETNYSSEIYSGIDDASE